MIPTLELAKKLIEIPSFSHDLEQNKNIVELCKNYLEDQGITVHTYEKNGHPSLVATLGDNTHPKVLLSGHLDVVFAEEKDFSPYEQDGKLFGRGAGDMKGPNAVMLNLICEFAQKEAQPSLGIMLTCDEEIGGMNGVNYLVHEEDYRAGIVIIPDSGRGTESIVTNQKGVLFLRLTTTGVPAHGSRPYQGESAIDKLLALYEQLRKVIPHLSEPKWVNTMNAGIIHGGEAVNKIAEHATMDLDIRFVLPEEEQRLLNEIMHICGEHAEIVVRGSCFTTEENNPFVQMYSDIAEGVLGYRPEYIREEGSSDARFFTEVGVPAIVTGVDKKNHHSHNEWVSIEAMERWHEIMKQFIEKEGY